MWAHQIFHGSIKLKWQLKDGMGPNAKALIGAHYAAQSLQNACWTAAAPATLLRNPTSSPRDDCCEFSIDEKLQMRKDGSHAS